MVVAAGPFATSDSIEMEPLHDLLGIVRSEEPDVLVLVSSWLVLCHCVSICVCVCMLCTPFVCTLTYKSCAILSILPGIVIPSDYRSTL